MSAGWCPTCGRPLYNPLVNASATCAIHGRVWSDWGSPLIVVNEEGPELEIIGRFVRNEESAVVYDNGGGEKIVQADCVSVIKASEWEGEWETI